MSPQIVPFGQYLGFPFYFSSIETVIFIIVDLIANDTCQVPTETGMSTVSGFVFIALKTQTGIHQEAVTQYSTVCWGSVSLCEQRGYFHSL